jgi:AmmeMemoRadiSam system protein A
MLLNKVSVTQSGKGLNHNYPIQKKELKTMAPLKLSNAEKKRLLQIARETLINHFSGEPIPEYTSTEPNLLEVVPVFVTLWRPNKVLRGCVGRVEVVEPLYRTVQYCAVAAGTRDFRFAPVKASELVDLTIEISVLSKPEKIDDPEQIEVGRHGLLIRQEEPELRVGLLLPQVATRRNWNRYQFLEAVCQKAALPPDAWQEADIYIFESEVFEEGEALEISD